MPRIYAPVTPDDLETLRGGVSITCADWFTAPTGLTGDALEEAEYDALIEAAAAASALVGEGRRRVVLAADVDRATAGAPLAVGPKQVASLHVDETTEHSDDDLLWYDASEIADVIAATV